MVDAKALVLFERVVKIIPPRVFTCVLIDLAKDVDESPPLQVLDSFPLRFSEMHFVFPERGLPDIHFMRGDIKITAEEDRFARSIILVEIFSKTLYPIQLEFKFVASELGSVRHVNIDDWKSVYRRRDQPLWRRNVIAGKISLNIFKRIFRNDRDPVV